MCEQLELFSHVAAAYADASGTLTSLPDFFIRLLTEPGDLVADLFGGTTKTGLAAERLGRRWIVTEWILQYLRGAAEMYRDRPGFQMHAALDAVGGHHG